MEEEAIELPSAIAAIRLLILTGCRLGFLAAAAGAEDVLAAASADRRKVGDARSQRRKT